MEKIQDNAAAMSLARDTYALLIQRGSERLLGRDPISSEAAIKRNLALLRTRLGEDTSDDELEKKVRACFEQLIHNHL